MLKAKKVCLVVFSLLLCAAVFSGCSQNYTQNKQNEVNAAFAEAVEKLNNSTHLHGTVSMEASDISMFNLDFHERYGDTVSSIKWSCDADLDVRKNNSGNVTDYRVTRNMFERIATHLNGEVSELKAYAPDDGYVYTNDGSNKVRSRVMSEFKSVDFAHPYLNNVEYLTDLTLETQKNKKIFNFKVSPLLAHWLVNFEPFDNYVNKTSAVKLVDVKGTLVTNDNSEQVSLTIDLEYKNIETNETFKASMSTNGSTSSHEIELPSDLDSYTDTGK